MLVKLQLQVLRKNLRFGQYFRFCANYANKISQKRAKLIAIHEQKMRKNSPKKHLRKNYAIFNKIVISWKPYFQRITFSNKLFSNELFFKGLF